MELVDINRFWCQRISSVIAEFIIIPEIVIRIVKNRCIIRSSLKMSGKRVAFLVNTAVCADDSVFIPIPLLCSGNLEFPDTRVTQELHLVAVGIPYVEISHNTDISGIWCPNSEYKSLLVAILIRM